MGVVGASSLFTTTLTPLRVPTSLEIRKENFKGRESGSERGRTRARGSTEKRKGQRQGSRRRSGVTVLAGVRESGSLRAWLWRFTLSRIRDRSSQR